MRDPIYDLLEPWAQLSSSDIPHQVISFQKKRLLDNLACMVAGQEAEGVDKLIDLFKQRGSSGPHRIIGRTDQLAMQDAAAVNALAARSKDYCDVLYSSHHPSSTDVAVCLAVAEKTGASGSDVLTAMALSIDFAERLVSIVPNGDYGGHDGQLVSCFCAALITCRFMQLSHEEMVVACGHALNRACGSMQSNFDRAITTRLNQAFAAQAGIECALFAKMGMTAPHNILFGEQGGFYQLFTDSFLPDRELLLEGLGHHFKGGPDALCIKSYPSCSVTASLTDAALSIAQKTVFSRHDIDLVHLRISAIQNMICGAPFHLTDTPEVDSIFSVQYVAANALLRGESKLKNFTREMVQDPTVLSLAQSITVEVCDYDVFDRCEVELRLYDGTVIRQSAQWGTGWPENPINETDHRDKVSDCYEFGGFETDAYEMADKLIACVNEIESSDGLKKVKESIFLRSDLSKCMSDNAGDSIR